MDVGFVTCTMDRLKVTDWYPGEIQRRIEALERENAHRSEAHHKLTNDYARHKVEARLRIEELEKEVGTIRGHLTKLMWTILGSFISGLGALFGLAKWGG